MMISYVANVINLLARTIQKVILYASFTGELIISIVRCTISCVAFVIDGIISFFNIVYEDNISLFKELPSSIKHIVDSFLNQLFYVQNTFQELSYKLYYEFISLTFNLTWIINSVYMIISEVLKLLVNTALFMGDTTWLIITFVPIHLPQLMRACTSCIADLIVTSIVDSYMRLLKFTNFLTEVPLESFLGITSAIVIVRLCVHFKEAILIILYNCYWSLVRNMLYLYHTCYNYFTNSDVQVISRMASGDIMSARGLPFENEGTDDASSADALCVICQEHQKCVLTLPCRHICLCTDCCRRLYGYQRTCPLCRTFIYHSVTVYW